MLEFSKDIVSKKQLEKYWENNIRPTVVYLHNPFCKTYNNCFYCLHKGCPKNNHTEKEVNDFYFKYMPKLFKYYENILNNQDIKLVDFGGGTPNYLSPEEFSEYLKLLPKTLLDKPKIIELHPALISKDFIKVLHDYKFTTLTFCFQTFDNNILRNQGRLIPNYDYVFECMEVARKLGMNIAVDLITYWTTEDGWEKVLEKDLRTLEDFQPDEITISVLYQNKYNRDDFNGLSVYRKIKRAVKTVFPEYENPENTLNECYEVAATRIYKPGSEIRKDFDIYLNSLSDMPWEHEQGYSTLGMGTYKNGDKAAYSMIGPDLLFYEEFNGFNKNPKVHKHRDYNFWETCRKTIDYLEKELGKKNPPVGENLILTNICESSNLAEEQFAHFFQKETGKWDMAPRQCFSEKSEFEKNIDINFQILVKGV